MVKFAFSAACAALAASFAFSAFGQDSSPAPAPAAPQAPPQTPRLSVYAEFTKNSRCPVFQPGEKVSLWLKVDGRRLIDDNLRWNLLDWKGGVLAQGSLPVPKGSSAWEGSLDLPQTKSGYFEVGLKLEKADVGIPRMGTRPAGFVSFAVLPQLEALKLDFVDQSRVGAQGTTFIKTGEFMKGDYVDPVYPLIGMKWVYRSRRLAEIAPKSLDDFKPVLDPAKMAESGKWSCEHNAKLCQFVDAHSLPNWLMKLPEGVDPSKFTATVGGQSYPPNDYEAYYKLIANVAAEQALNRKVNFPFQRRSYYEIHWEPDWHWKGSDEDFIKMYEVAWKAIHDNDPDGLLLGANYGVLATGNKHMERLFAKGWAQWLDGIVFHTYYIPEVQNPERGNLINDMRKLVEMARANLRPGAPLINSEWGTNYGSSPAIKDHSSLYSETQRFMRGHLISLGEGADTDFYFYTADGSEHGGGLFFNLTAPHPVYGATHVAPKPLTSSAAFATRLLEGTKNLGPMEHLGDGVWGYAFDRAGVAVAALWSVDDQEREIALPVGVDSITVYDPMGNPSQAKAKDGVASIVVGAIPCYVSGFSRAAVPSLGAKAPEALPGGSIEVASGFKCQLRRGQGLFDLGEGPSLTLPRKISSGSSLLVACDPKDGHWISSSLLNVKGTAGLVLEGSSVKVSNAASSELKGTLSVARQGFDASFFAQVSVPANSSLGVPLDLKKAGLDGATDIDVTMKFVDANGSASTASASLRSSYVARRALHPPSMNGTASDWQLELFKTVTLPEAVSGGDSDLSFRFAMLYDDSKLYCAFKVRDQSHVQERWEGDSWNEDSVQLAIALHPEAGDWKLFHKFCFAKRSKLGEIMEFKHNGTKELPAGKITQDEVACAISRNGDETVYTVAIPWTSLEKSLKGAPPEHKIGVGILVNDVDFVNGQKTGRKTMEAFGGMGYTVSKDFGTVSLE